MTTSAGANVEVNDETRGVLAALAQGDPDLLATGLELRADWKAKTGLDGRSYALVKLAALIALDAPPASSLALPGSGGPSQRGGPGPHEAAILGLWTRLSDGAGRRVGRSRARRRGPRPSPSVRSSLWFLRWT
jgi:hypothetical protein